MPARSNGGERGASAPLLPTSNPLLDLPSPSPHLSPSPSPTVADRPRTPRPYPASPSAPSQDEGGGTDADDEMPRKLPAPPRRRSANSAEFIGNKTRLTIELFLIGGLVGGVAMGGRLKVDWARDGIRWAVWAVLLVGGWVWAAWKRRWRGGASGDIAEWVYPAVVPVLMAAQIDQSMVNGNLLLSLGSLPVGWRECCVGILVSEDWDGEGCWMWALQGELCDALSRLLIPSLSRTEIRLMTIGLVDLLWYGERPHMVVLKASLWIGGLSIWFLLDDILRWGVQIARVPKHRFKRLATAVRAAARMRSATIGDTTDDEEEGGLQNTVQFTAGGSGGPRIPIQIPIQVPGPSTETLTVTKLRRRSSTNTSSSSYYWRGLSYEQAQTRKLIYAGIVYTTIALVTVFGISSYISVHAFGGHPLPFFMLSYLFCGQPIYGELLNFVPLLSPSTVDLHATCKVLLSTPTLTPATPQSANQRLLIALYWAVILGIGLTLNLILKPHIILDTRRKIFHLTIVAILLPTARLDPPFTALALSFLLPAFLLSDLIRASTLPPFSKPIAEFLAPFVDGRDLRGPVVVSHVFLLLGCAVPLWLSLSSDDAFHLTTNTSTTIAPLTPASPPSNLRRLVAGVVCVGIGDAMASLTGKRWGHKSYKWGWGGGKTLIGSLGFVGGVFIGFLLAGDLGSGVLDMLTLMKLAVLSAMGGLWEAVVRGGNDNLVVPGVVWLGVGGMGV